MKHGYFGRKLGRNKDERKRLFRQLYHAMFANGQVKTTLAKAKSVQPTIEKLITSAKKNTSPSLRQVEKVLADHKTIAMLMDMVKTRFSKRTSGYTRVTKLGKRRGDASEMVILEFVDAAPKREESTAPKTAKKTKAGTAVVDAEIVEEKETKEEKKPKAAKKETKKKETK